MAQVEAALARVQSELGATEYEVFRRLVNTLMAVNRILQSQRAMTARLRRLFGLSSTEKTRSVTGACQPSGTDAGAADASGVDEPNSGAGTPPATGDGNDKGKPPGHGRIPTSMYKGAKHIWVPHQLLCAGGACPDCRFGKLYELKEPAQYLRVLGQPMLTCTCHDAQRLRCSNCGRVFTAKLPEEVLGPKFDASAVAMIALCRYSLVMPHHRIAHMQKQMGIPIPASTQWEVIFENAPAFEPIFGEFERLGAQGELIHSDDTYARVLSFMGERRAEMLRNGELPNPERVGLFTTALLCFTHTLPVLLFYTGRKYAGENLADLLKVREHELGPPVLMCDGLESRNLPAGHTVISANCLTHGRRNFVEEAVNFPHECKHVLEELRKVYVIDAYCRKAQLSKQERLAVHQRESEPVMSALKQRMEQELRDKRVEPNSGLGKAYAYMLKRWEKLTLFLRRAGAPLDNNVCERALKLAIRHRRNSLSYRSERGAEIGDMFMSIIYTAELHNENPFEYLTAVLRNEKAVATSPADWLPWTYRATLARSNEPQDGPNAAVGAVA